MSVTINNNCELSMTCGGCGTFFAGKEHTATELLQLFNAHTCVGKESNDE